MSARDGFRPQLRGRLRLPGDKSATHRSLLLGACAAGTTVVRGALDGADTRSTAALVSALGAQVDWDAEQLAIRGCPRLQSPATLLDCGNSGTTARLVSGLLAGRPGTFTLDGDSSLRRRPMGRVLDPLRSLGATIHGAGLPVTLGGSRLRGGEVLVELPSAQVKSALLLAGLSCDGPLTVLQHTPTRDHTERMLPAFGARVETAPGSVTIEPGELTAASLEIPADPSSAAFLVVAALLLPGSELVLEDVGLWQRRTGFLTALERAGARIEVLSRRGAELAGNVLGAGSTAAPQLGDPRGELLVRATPLQAFDIAPEDVPDLVDEVPVLALAAALARGTSRFAGLGELRLKESDRVAAIAEMLSSLGVSVELTADELLISGSGRLQGRANCHHDDHRLAMTATLARLLNGEPLPQAVPAAAISWPGFLSTLAGVSSSR